MVNKVHIPLIAFENKTNYIQPFLKNLLFLFPYATAFFKNVIGKNLRVSFLLLFIGCDVCV